MAARDSYETLAHKTAILEIAADGKVTLAREIPVGLYP
jgi:hypothetical protein